VRGPGLTPVGSNWVGVAFWLSLRHKRGRRRRRLSGRGCSSGVEHNLAKVGVEGSNPFARSNKPLKSLSADRYHGGGSRRSAQNEPKSDAGKSGEIREARS
jgi:hypothetical protein